MNKQIKTNYKLNVTYDCLFTNNCDINKFYCNHICRDLTYDNLSISNNFDNIIYNINLFNQSLSKPLSRLLFEKLSIYNNVSGRVICKEDNQPISNCLINFIKQDIIVYQTLTDENGFFDIGDVLYGKYYLECDIQDQPYTSPLIFCNITKDIKYLILQVNKK